MQIHRSECEPPNPQSSAASFPTGARDSCRPDPIQLPISPPMGEEPAFSPPSPMGEEPDFSPPSPMGEEPAFSPPSPMGEEPDFSPPPPEPTHSPEPEIPGHGNRNWKADMMSALGESVSFGRFFTEPLEWGKWSAFAHNRYLEEAAVQARPGSVAQKKAFFEEHYATKKKRKSEDHSAAANDDGGLEASAEEDAGSATSRTSSSAESSCMTDQALGDEETGVVDCAAPCASHEPVGVAEELAAVADAESSIVNQDITDLAKKSRIQMSSLIQKPHKFRSPPSGKKGKSSVKRWSPLHSAKENTSPAVTDNSMQGTTSVPKKRSTLGALHMPKSFSRCEMGNAASCSRNVGTTIAERISQLESASRPVATAQLQELGPPRKIFSPFFPEIALGTSQVDGQRYHLKAKRSSHVMRIKEKLFGSASPSVHQKTGTSKEKVRKFTNETEFKESRQSCNFRARPLPNFYRRNRQGKDTSQQTAQEFPKFRDRNYSQADDSHAHQMSKGVSKERQICCFPMRKLY